MSRFIRPCLLSCILGAAAVLSDRDAVLAQNTPPPDTPAVVVKGVTYTPRSILARNMGSEADRLEQFPPYKVAGNIYYIGTKTLSSFLITTAQGHILMDTTYEKNANVLAKSVADLGFKMSDIKIILGNHAHGDHMEGDAAIKAMTGGGAQVTVMAEDVPALEAMTPGGKAHPIDKILHDRDTVTLGGVTLTAHLTAGHTRGCTTYTTTVSEGGKSYNVVFSCSLRAPNTLTPPVIEEMTRSFSLVRKLPCDIQVGDHPAQFQMYEKYERLKKAGPTGPNPFIDPLGCNLETDIQEAMFKAVLGRTASR